MKKQLFLVLMLSGLLLSACNQPNSGGNSGKSGGPADDSDLGTLEIHTDLMKSYLADSWDSILTYVPKVNAEDSSYHNDLSQPNALKLEFAEVADADNYYVQIAKDEAFTDPKEVQVNTKYYNFYNSEIGQQYYYRAAVDVDALAQAKVRKFKVAPEAPRQIHAEGVINFRDVGGWESSLVQGARINQGLYYRCAQFNDIKAQGLEVIKELNIKVDIDMRDSYSVPSTSPISTADHPVEILKASVASGSEDGRWEGDHSRDHNIAATYKSIFEAIAVADQKPIALHCTHGADRTGIVSWFLLGLLGVSKEDCGRDYVMTRFAGERAVLPTNEIAKWNQKTEALAGNTWAEKTYKHLNEDFNISVDTLETIRELFIPGYTRPAAA